jgi:hypothetical protein
LFLGVVVAGVLRDDHLAPHSAAQLGEKLGVEPKVSLVRALIIWTP